MRNKILIPRNRFKDCLYLYNAIRSGQLEENADYKKFLMEADAEASVSEAEMQEYIDNHPYKDEFENEDILYDNKNIKVKELPLSEEYKYFQMRDAAQDAKSEDDDTIALSEYFNFGMYIIDNSGGDTKGGDIQASFPEENIVSLIHEFVEDESPETFNKEKFGKALYNEIISMGEKPSVFFQPGWKVVVGEFAKMDKKPTQGKDLMADPTSNILVLEVESVKDGKVNFKKTVLQEHIELKKFLREMYLIMNKYDKSQIRPLREVKITKEKK